MKKVLFVVDEKETGGVSIVLEDILKNTNKKNVDISLLVLHPTGDRLSNIEGIKYIEGSKFYRNIDKSLKQVLISRNIFDIFNKFYLIFLMKTGLIKYKIKSTREKFINENFDIEIAFKDGFCTLFTAFGDSKTKITWLHTDYSNNDPAGHYNKIFSSALEKLDVIVAISNDVKRKFNHKYGQDAKTIIINNYVDKNKVVSGGKCDKISFDGNINFVTVGRLCPVKGYDRLLKALGRLKREDLLDGITLNMIGDGESRGYLKSLINQYSLDSNVKLYGNKINPYPYLKAADMLIMTSLSEAYPLVTIESLILGTPVFTCEFSSVYEMLEPNYNSLVVENNEEAIYNGLKKIITQRDMINLYKLNLKRSNYSNKKIIEQIESLWK